MFINFHFKRFVKYEKNISRGKTKYGISPQDLVTTRESKLTTGLVSQTKLNNFLNILGNLNEQIEMLRMQNKKKVENVALHNSHLITLTFVKFVQDHILLKIAHHYQG